MIMLSLLCSMCFSSCESRDEIQEKAINEYMNKTYADFPSYECVETQYLDSIQDYPCDYKCLIAGLKTYKALYAVIEPAADFTQCYAKENNLVEGQHSFNPQLLQGITKQKYLVWMDSVRTFAVAKHDIEQKVESYHPHAYIRVFKKYRVNKNGKHKFIIARFYFDENLKFTNQLILSEEENNCVTGIINLAMNHDFSSINTLFKKFVELPNDEVLNFLSQYPTMPIEDLLNMPMNNMAETQADVSNSTDYNNYTERSNAANSLSSAKGGNIYVVTTKCGGATSKAAEKRFTKYSVNGDIEAIDEMMLRGELIPLQKGEEVIMLDLGFITSKVRTSHGIVVYVDTEYLRNGS